MIESKRHRLLIFRMLVGSILMVWPQFSTNSAQASCKPSLPTILETMESAEPVIINESLIVEDIKKAYKALATPGNTPRSIALQFGTIDTTSLNENEVKPFNSDIQSIVVFRDFIDFDFRPHSLISLSALQKAFGNYAMSRPVTNRTGSRTTYSIRFVADPAEVHGKQIIIYLYHKSFDFKTDKIEAIGVSIVG